MLGKSPKLLVKYEGKSVSHDDTVVGGKSLGEGRAQQRQWSFAVEDPSLEKWEKLEKPSLKELYWDRVSAGTNGCVKGGLGVRELSLRQGIMKPWPCRSMVRVGARKVTVYGHCGLICVRSRQC
ncbi:hypothetical protein Q3G72_021856 [Acer saccharum]|nr:hypothetical protein Q3G72_021856 [Acer saccharum]